jgi:hypothetical protein
MLADTQARLQFAQQLQAIAGAQGTFYGHQL